ncbi:MAG: nucleotidyl transferase AbiEii/AbiGii toxin family protein [Flavobacteriales bacterium]|jgi:predicted nucleotidyltransferase component of viral defense system
MLHKNTVEQSTLELLIELMDFEELSSFILVGGTALSLQIGHRISIDLDFFTQDIFDENQLLEILVHKYPDSIVTSKASNTLNLFIKGVKVDFIRHNYKALSSLTSIENIRLSSLQDIAAMKINAVCNRGCKKDFYDIFYLLNHFSLMEILQLFSTKYKNTDLFFAQKSLVYFLDADVEPNPNTINSSSWEHIKKTIVEEINAMDPQ